MQLETIIVPNIKVYTTFATSTISVITNYYIITCYLTANDIRLNP